MRGNCKANRRLARQRLLADQAGHEVWIGDVADHGGGALDGRVDGGHVREDKAGDIALLAGAVPKEALFREPGGKFAAEEPPAAGADDLQNESFRLGTVYPSNGFPPIQTR